MKVAQTVGVDLSQIYMMLNNSCNSWGQYLCPQMKDGQIVYPNAEGGQKGAPLVCDAGEKSKYSLCVSTSCMNETPENYSNCVAECARATCQPCTLIKVLTESKEDQDAVYEGWINAEKSTDNGNTTVVACASGVLDSAKLFARGTRIKNGANLVDMDMLELWLDQIGPDKKGNVEPYAYCYCATNTCSVSGDMKDILRKSALSKTVDTDKMYCKMDNSGRCSNARTGTSDASYINPIYAICDAHQYNAGMSGNDLGGDKIAEIKEIVGLKTTVVSQQMYKQYEYLNATLRRLKTQLEKAALTATLETAGAKSEGSSSSSSGGLLGGSGNNDDKTIHLPGANNCSNLMDFDSAYNCLQNNVALIKSNVNTNTKKACLQLQETVKSANAILSAGNKSWSSCQSYTNPNSYKSCEDSTKDNIRACADEINFNVMKEKRDQSQQSKQRDK